MQPLVVLLPGRAPRVLGMSARTRNERVAERVGAATMAPQTLGECGDQPAVLVPAGVIIDVPLFPFPALTGPTWLVGDSNAAVLAGPAQALVPYLQHLDTASGLERLSVSSAGVLDVSSMAARRRTAWSVLLRTGKPADGWVSRHCTRPLSRPVSFVLLWMGLTANHASLLTLLVGFATAALALTPGYLPLVGTGVLFQLTSVLDGVDGEMARATLGESESGALLDTIVDQLTYISCFVGVTIGWVREGAGLSGLLWTAAITLAMVLSLMRGWRFVTTHAPNSSFVFIDRSVRRAARDSGLAALKAAAAMFTLLRRDAFATMFFFIALTGRRALIPAICGLGVVLANVTLTRYRRELAAAAVALQRPAPSVGGSPPRQG